MMYAFVQFKDIEVLFGSYDTDVIVSYTACFGLMAEKKEKEMDEHPMHPFFGGWSEVIYDEIKMVTSANVESKNDMVYPTILKHKVLYDDGQ